MMAGSVSEIFISFASSKRLSDFILAACDVEGNFLVVKAFQYTDLLSCMLLNSWVFFFQSEFLLTSALLTRWAIPTCMFFSYLFMGTRCTWTQLAVCV